MHDWLHDYLVGRLGKSIVDNKEEFHKWSERMVWHVKRCNELSEERHSRQWIPCSERLPEESGYCIITAHDGVGHRTTFAKFQKKAKSWDLTGARSYWRVIAWMPLPEPYKGGGAERRTDER